MLKESADLVILGVTFDAKMIFEKHLSSVSSAAAQRLVIMRKSWQVFHDRSLLLRSFWSIVLPVLEYCPAVWCSAADSNIKGIVQQEIKKKLLSILEKNYINKTCRSCFAELFLFVKIFGQP